MSAFTSLINAGSSLLQGEAGKTITLLPTGTGKNAQLSGAMIECAAIVQQLRKGRAMDQNGNWRDIYTGRVSLTFAKNPLLENELSTIQSAIVPEQWKFEMDGVKYRIINPSKDETAWEFDIKEAV